MALARTGNVNAGDLYTFFTNDTNAFNNIVSIGGQVRTETMQRLPKYFMKMVHIEYGGLVSAVQCEL